MKNKKQQKPEEPKHIEDDGSGSFISDQDVFDVLKSYSRQNRTVVKKSKSVLKKRRVK